MPSQSRLPKYTAKAFACNTGLIYRPTVDSTQDTFGTGFKLKSTEHSGNKVQYNTLSVFHSTVLLNNYTHNNSKIKQKLQHTPLV